MPAISWLSWSTKLSVYIDVEISSSNKTYNLCNQNDWGYVDHSNISADHDLNRSGLHLNAKGTARLASNFIKFLKLRGD